MQHGANTGPKVKKPQKTKTKLEISLITDKNNHTPSTSSSAIVLMPVKPWHCPRCTFENTKSEVVCDMCSMRSNHLEPPDQIERLSPEELANKHWNYIVRYCKLIHQFYVDDTFPPGPTSLYYNGAEHKNALVVKWRRLRDINFNDDPDRDLPLVVFRRRPLPSDVWQGILHDCWLLSAIAVLTEREDLLRAVLVTEEICTQGVYQIRLCKDGHWMTVLVDDFFPCDKERYLCYSQSIRRQLWVPLIEKAVAKIHGCYEALNVGRTFEGLATLTGAPCESILLQASPIPSEDEIDKDLIWTQLLSSRQANFPMTITSGNRYMKVSIVEYQRCGLIPRHAYSVLDVRDVNEHRLLQLRNPIGDECVWTGDWSNDSHMWTHYLRFVLMPDGPQDGIFWISFNDVKKYFYSIDICKIRNGWNDIRLSGILPPFASPQHLSCILLTVLEVTEVDLTLYQECQRKVENSQRFELDLCLGLFKARNIAPPNIDVLVQHSKRKIQNFVGCNKVLEPGQYIVVPLAFKHWHTGLEDPVAYPRYVLAIHSTKNVLAKQMAPPQHILADSIISLTLALGQIYEETEGMIVYYLKDWTGLVFMVENWCEDKWVQVKCDCQESYNVVSTRGTLQTVDSVPPLHRQVITVITQQEGCAAYSIMPRLIHRLVNSHDPGAPSTLRNPKPDYQTCGLHNPRPIT